ncbi:hypothetical protein AB0L53_34235 [Nonomuraea sp. NPDC052129]|uniref:hypothetical protein n=1 Tax=Nonomuraea sp. NPDC052129 TaxID=3154651 RepID=UPI00343EBD14
MTSTDNFWSAENIARRAGRAQQEFVTEQAAQQQAQRQDFMAVVGRTLVDIVNGYTANVRPAETADVMRDFQRVFPQAGPADFRQSVDALKQEGVLYESLGAEGFMGQRSTRLHVL